jgi:hypothetical protein
VGSECTFLFLEAHYVFLIWKMRVARHIDAQGFFLFLILFKQYFNTNPKNKIFVNLTLLVAPARVARLYHSVVPHAPARQGEPP